VRATGAVVVDDQAHLNARKGRRGHVICGASLRRASLEFATPQAPSQTRYLKALHESYSDIDKLHLSRATSLIVRLS
jgi:hypothetical protein